MQVATLTPEKEKRHTLQEAETQKHNPPTAIPGSDTETPSGIGSTERRLSKLWETVKDREAWRAAVHRAAESDTPETEQQQNVLPCDPTSTLLDIFTGMS